MTEGSSQEMWVELQWKGQRLYLPGYTKEFRRIEGRIVESLLSLGFEECLFTKLLTYSQYSELRNALPRFAVEWSEEVVSALDNSDECAGYPKRYTLSHWQCEPFYYLLKKSPPSRPVKYFDRSGWTYRVEKDVSDYRLFEFQRIECVFFLHKDEARKELDTLLRTLNVVISELGLETHIREQHHEEAATSELLVKDIEIKIDESRFVEVVGAHLHGRLFIDKLAIPAPDDYYTGCCGIGLSRIANAVVSRRIAGRDV